MKKIAIFIAVGALLLLGAAPALANGIPKLPHAFYGTVTINNAQAPNGTQVSATVDIGEIISTQNPVTTAGGSYGISSSYLLVQGYDIPDGATITFYVNGHSTNQTDTFIAGGGPTEINLTVTIYKPSPPPPTVETSLFGIEGSFPISDEGEILETIVATSEDEDVTITIEEGTTALDIEGKPLETLTAAVEASPPEPPEDTHFIGAYDFGPDGATFDPPLTLTWSYDPETLPEDVDLVIAYYDEVTEEWVWVPCEVDTENNIITASVAHFTTFAIIAVPVVTPPAPAAFSVSSLSVLPAEVEPDEAVTIAISVANTGGKSGSYTVVLKIDGVKEAEETVTIAAGESQDVSFSVTREEADTYTVTVDGLSSSFTVVPVVVPPAPAAFSVSSVSVLPTEVEPGETVTIAVSISNTGGKSGSYTVVLKIDGVKEAEKTVTVAAGKSKDVSFSVTREETGSYTVAVDGLSGSFTVVAPPEGEEEEEEVTKPGINWPLIGGIIGGVIVVGLGVFFFIRRRRAY